VGWPSSTRRRAVLAFALASVSACGGGPEQPIRTADSRRSREAPPPLSAGRAVPAGDPETIALLGRFLTPPVAERPCGAYVVRSNLAGPALERAATICATIAAGLEGEIAAIFGIVPAHPPRGSIVLFASRGRFRESVAAAGDLNAGYAGWSAARLGVVAIAADGVGDDELARTLAHELAHLAERRLFGFPRPRWLAEGLADALSDSASADGFAPLADLRGIEAARRRWLERAEPARFRGAIDGEVGPLERLVALGEDAFDAGAASLDYELSALFVRFLLLDPLTAPRFRDWLAGQTLQSATIPDLTGALGTDWPELERRFAEWVGRSS